MAGTSPATTTFADGSIYFRLVIPGWSERTRPQMCNSTSGNLEISGSLAEPVIGPASGRTRWLAPGMTK